MAAVEMEADTSSPGHGQEPGERQPGFRKPVHDTSQRNYRRRSPSASTSPSPPPAGGWKRDRSVSPGVAGGGGSGSGAYGHAKKERRLNADQRDADASRSRKGNNGTSNSFARPSDRDYGRRQPSGHHERAYSSHSGRDGHGEGRNDHASQDGDNRMHDRSLRDRYGDRGRGKDWDRSRDRERGRGAWDRSRDRERERDRGRDRGRNETRIGGRDANAVPDAERERDRERERARARDGDRVSNKDEPRDRDRRRERVHKDGDDAKDHLSKDTLKERDRLKERYDLRDRIGRGDLKERDHRPDVYASKEAKQLRDRDDHVDASNSKRASCAEKTSGGGTLSLQEKENHAGQTERASLSSEAVEDEHGSDGSNRPAVGQSESKAAGEGTKGQDENSKLVTEKASPSKVEDGEIQNEATGGSVDGDDRASLVERSSAPAPQSGVAPPESKRVVNCSEAKMSKSSKWGPEANTQSEPGGTTGDLANDLSVAKLAALKAAEMVNKNLGVSGCLSADQKKKLLWGKKKEVEQEPAALAGTNRWDTVQFADRDRQEKFQKLMGVKGEHKDAGEAESGLFTAEKQRELQQDLEKQFTAGLRRRDGRTVGLGL